MAWLPADLDLVAIARIGADARLIYAALAAQMLTALAFKRPLSGLLPWAAALAAALALAGMRPALLLTAMAAPTALLLLTRHMPGLFRGRR